ncbi:MAG: tyrosine-type recombinase/integrase [Clostridium sp.]
MAVYKDGDKWRVIYRYTNWQGERKQTQKRGFKTKREAQQWEREVMLKSESKLDMTFASFFEIYEADKKKRVKENTWESKSHIIRTKILPYFGNRKIAEIEPKDVIAWQSKLLGYQGENGEVYSPTYLKTIHSQLSAIFNHAVRFYHLPSNPAQKAGTMGCEEHKEMLFWTKEEYLKFADVMMDKTRSYYAFEMLYWCGVRMGELLALTPADFDFERQTVTINKSYQRLKGRDVITSPKTVKSNRTIKMPKFLCEEMQDYIRMLYDIGENKRIFQITKSYLHHEMDRGAKVAGVKRIRIHDLRHSHISLLIEMGFSALAIADRVGHESIDITYRYAHLFPNKQTEMANQLDRERKAETLPPEEHAVSKNHAAERSVDSQVKKERMGYDG